MEEARLYVGDQGNRIYLRKRKLRFRVKGADAFDFFSKEFESVGLLVAKRKYVQDSPTNGVLSRLVDEVGAFKVVGRKDLRHKGHVYRLANARHKGVFYQGALVDHFFVERFGIGDDDAWGSLVFQELVEHFCPQEYIGIVYLVVLVGTLEASRKNAVLVAAQQIL